MMHKDQRKEEITGPKIEFLATPHRSATLQA